MNKEYVPYNVCLRIETVYPWFFFFPFLLRVVMVTVLFFFQKKTEFAGILNGF